MCQANIKGGGMIELDYYCPNCQRVVKIRKRKDGTFTNCPVCKNRYKKSSMNKVKEIKELR